MLKREIKLPSRHSFFLFGPRQTGKSTLLHSLFNQKTTLYYDLLHYEEYRRLITDPSLFREEVISRHKNITHVVVDEIQRVPELLNEVHSLMEGGQAPYFALSGSSTRKLKKAHANLLAGRAWTYHLHPLTCQELGERFSLDKALQLGTLPSVILSEEEESSIRTLRSYVETYLKEEIEQEALVRNLPCFLRFLTLAADENGNIINYSNISRETGTSYVTVKKYFQILEDTLIGFALLPYSKSIRTRLVKHPKFYFFDTGVKRAILKKASVPIERGTSEYGKAFEHFMICEIKRAAEYKEKDYSFYFYQSSNHAEVDLIIEPAKGKTLALEIKANPNPDISQLRGLKSFVEVCPQAELFCVCSTTRKRKAGMITFLPWQEIMDLI
ncbi:MAG: ATP-binding protein [Elusimicrobia bacterium]|nr:ATP-binding protein [Elusimicrobiota bacterium]